MQISNDKNTQLKITWKNKLVSIVYRVGELFVKMTKRIPVNNSIKGYFIGILSPQLIHLPFCLIQLNIGIFSIQLNLDLQLGQKLLGFMTDKSFGNL